ncbi:MAG: gamma-glutamyltransferase family protein [Telmatospirillum sp.]|nr:gamma-glutamyltransferase family protein [Telmatospirillum sp.]
MQPPFLSLPSLDVPNPYPTPGRPVLARNVVATSQPLAAEAGLWMLRCGGNAVDAAIAAAITLTVVEPTGCGLGSDAFAMVWDGARFHGLNASGRSPAAWNSDRFAGRKVMPERGWESVVVPGAVSGWAALSERFGRLPFADLCQPAIDYARRGFAVTPTVAHLWARGAALLKDQPGFAETFLPDGEAPGAGKVFRSEAMARTIERIANSRGEDFYRGELARRIADFATEHGAALTARDLADHSNDWVAPLSVDFYDSSLQELPPNGQGLAALIAAGILSELGVDALPPDSAGSLHLQIEAMKLAFADLHHYVADPDHMARPAEAFLDRDYLRTRARLVDHRRAGLPVYGVPRRGGTVYLTAADANGMMVSFIQSNYMGFGSGVVVPGTGISLQNRGCGFRAEPGHANSVGPRKRPFHTIIPGFASRQGHPVMSYGVMGAAMQAQGHVQMALRVLLHGQDPQMASDAPRWRVTGGLNVALESRVAPTVAAELASLGHHVTVEPEVAHQAFGGAQAIVRMNGVYAGGSDHRKDGRAVGF